MKNYYKALTCCCLLVATTIIGTIHNQAVTKKVDGKDIINRYYTSITGFGIGSDDEKKIVAQGGAPTYGEMTLEGTDTLLELLKPTKKDVFVDGGSGVGKVAVHCLFSTDICKSCGVELSQERCQKALSVKNELEKNNELPKNKKLEFLNQNILDADLSDATIFFMCSTCFSEDLMKKITEKLATLKPGLRVVTLKQLPEHKKFVLKNQVALPMTWSQATPVYIYELQP